MSTAAPPIKPPIALAQFSPLSLARMLWLHRFGILLIWFLTSVITAAIVESLPAQYQAEISILVEPQKIPGNVVQSMVDRKSTRLNSSHVKISYAVFCLKK